MFLDLFLWKLDQVQRPELKTKSLKKPLLIAIKLHLKNYLAVLLGTLAYNRDLSDPKQRMTFGS